MLIVAFDIKPEVQKKMTTMSEQFQNPIGKPQ
jgi:hypothetical protein